MTLKFDGLSSIEKKMNDALEQYKEEHLIRCPYCKEVLYDCGINNLLEDDLPITYWGEDSKQEIQCPACDKTFFCQEHVDRTWETRKLEKE